MKGKIHMKEFMKKKFDKVFNQLQNEKNIKKKFPLKGKFGIVIV